MCVSSSMARFQAMTFPSRSMANVASGRKLMISERRFSDSLSASSALLLFTACRILWASSVN